MQKIKSILSNHSDKESNEDLNLQNNHSDHHLHNTGTTSSRGAGISNNTTDQTGTNVGGLGNPSSSTSSAANADRVIDRASHKHNNVGTLPTDGTNTVADHKHLAAITKEKIHEHEIEEINRTRELETHHHHIQHHVQPLVDERHHDTQHSEKIVPVNVIQEHHANTEEDRANFNRLNLHKDSVDRGERERSVVDKGETVSEQHHHHVHHIVQPIIERDVHKHHVTHTTIPTHQTVHEAPIVHQSTQHAPMHIKDFISGGGDLKSKLSHDHAGVLVDGQCERDVENLPVSDRPTGNNAGIPIGSHHPSTTTGTTSSTTSNVQKVGGTVRGNTDTNATGLAGEVHQERERMEHVPAERMDQGAGFGARGART